MVVGEDLVSSAQASGGLDVAHALHEIAPLRPILLATRLNRPLNFFDGNPEGCGLIDANLVGNSDLIAAAASKPIGIIIVVRKMSFVAEHSVCQTKMLATRCRRISILGE
jgi:hypothetical protein